MKRRSVVGVAVLTILTCGIYGLYWIVKTKSEMNAQGANVPTAWLILIPIVNIWWTWKFSEGVNHVTKGGMSAGVTFLLLWLLGIIGQAIVQSALNKVARG